MQNLIAMVVTVLGEADEYVSNTEINEVIVTVLNIVDETLMPILYLGLSAFLVIKGAILGTQIVKAADEPQVRQEKINSLKYLIIGIAIAFGVSFASSALINYFKDTLQ